MMKKNLNRAIAMMLCATFSVGTAVSANAQTSPRFARSSEEWAELEDNQLEWEEIPDLIHEYNATVKNNWIAYDADEDKTNQEIRDRYLDAAADYDELTIQAEVDGDYISAAKYRAKAESARKNADENVADAQISYWEYEQIEKNLVQSARTAMINYYTALLQQELDQEKVNLLTEQARAVKNKFDVGMATQMDVITSEESLAQSRAALITDESAILKAKQNLNVMCGWGSQAEPVYGTLPLLSSEEIAKIDLEADLNKALSTNFQLRIDQRKLENASTDALTRQYQKTIQQDKEQIKADVVAKYQALKEAESACSQAALNRTYLEQTKEQIKRKLETGQAVALELKEAENKQKEAEINEKMKAIVLLSTYESYRAAVVDGLAVASAAVG